MNFKTEGMVGTEKKGNKYLVVSVHAHGLHKFILTCGCSRTLLFFFLSRKICYFEKTVSYFPSLAIFVSDFQKKSVRKHGVYLYGNLRPNLCTIVIKHKWPITLSIKVFQTYSLYTMFIWVVIWMWAPKIHYFTSLALSPPFARRNRPPLARWITSGSG